MIASEHGLVCKSFDAWLPTLQAGMAGGTGGGGAAVVADIARQLGAFTVAIAMLPESGLPAVDKVSSSQAACVNLWRS